MPDTNSKQESAPKSCKDCERWQEIKQKFRISEVLSQAMEDLGERVKSKEFKLTLGDYLKLLQLEKELEETGPKEIKVTWIDPAITSKPEK